MHFICLQPELCLFETKCHAFIPPYTSNKTDFLHLSIFAQILRDVRTICVGSGRRTYEKVWRYGPMGSGVLYCTPRTMRIVRLIQASISTMDDSYFNLNNGRLRFIGVWIKFEPRCTTGSAVLARCSEADALWERSHLVGGSSPQVFLSSLLSSFGPLCVGPFQAHNKNQNRSFCRAR